MTAGYLPTNVGGTQVHIRSLVRAFEGDHEVRILCRAADPEDEEYALRNYSHEGIRVDTINNTFRDAKGFPYLYASSGVDDAFAELLDAWPPDLVHVHHLTCLSTRILDELARREIPTVMTLHDFWMVCPRGQRVDTDGAFQDPIDREHCLDCVRRTWPGFFPDTGHPLADRAAREMLAAWDDDTLARLRQVDRIIVPSTAYAEFFADWGLDTDRIDVIEHGLERDGFGDVDRTDSPDGKLRVGVLGTVIPSKGVHLLLEAAAGLGESISLHVHGEFVPYHEDDGYRARLEAAIPADVETTLHGRYEPARVPEILANLDVLVVPSTWHEAFGITLREGFLAGVPVVAANHGGLAEAIADGRGIGFRPGDAADLRAALEALVADPALRARMRGRPEWVRDVRSMADETMATYRSAQARVAARPDAADDPFRRPFLHAVDAVGARSRDELLRAAAAGLRTVAGRLGIDRDFASLLEALPDHSWPVRDAYSTHRNEADWLRGQRSALEDEIRSLRDTIALRDETIASTEAETRYQREEAERRAATIEALKREADAQHEATEALRGECERRAAAREALREESERMQRDLTAQVDGLTRERDSLQGDFEKACDALHEAVAAKGVSDGEVERLRAHAQDVVERLDATSTRLDETEKRLDDVTARHDAAATDAEALRAERDACRELLRAIAASRAARFAIRGELGRRLEGFRP